MSRKTNGQFTEGNAGRPAGSRNRLQADFVSALAEDFAEHGAETIRIMRTEEPTQYVKVIASILPKEFLVGESALSGATDEELMAIVEKFRREAKSDNQAH